MKKNNNGKIDFSKTINKRIIKIKTIKGYKDLFIQIMLFGIGLYILLTYFLSFYITERQDMFPTIIAGDLSIIWKFNREFKTSDVILYNFEESYYLGRVVAKENDIVLIDKNSILTINNAASGDNMLFPTEPYDSIIYPYKIPKSGYFVLGDYRTHSEDSRKFGAVSEKDIVGKVITIIRRRKI